MATLSANNPTLLDLAKVMAPDGSIDDVVEILMEQNEILLDMVWVEGNLPTGNRSVTRTGIPEPTWRKFYGGVQPNKSTYAQITDNAGSLWAYAEVDAELAEMSGNIAAFRLREDKGHIEGMNQEMANKVFFGNENTEPEAFTGLSPRYSSLSAESGDNIIDGAGTGTDNRSIWLVVWGDDLIHGIVPKGSTAGLKMTDKGLVTLEDASDGSNSGRMEAYRTVYNWQAGLTVRDWRFGVRIANIDKSLTLADASSGPNLPDLMFEAINLVPNLSRGKPAFYMSRDIRTKLYQQTSAAVASSTLQTTQVGGTIVTSFHGVPIRRCDALAADESQIT